MCHPRSIALLSVLAGLTTVATARGETAIATSPTKVLKNLTYTGAMRLDQIAKQDGSDRSLAPYFYVAGATRRRTWSP